MVPLYKVYIKILGGVATSFPQTEEIIENGKVSGMTATDVQKILNLKHAWEFILDRDVVASCSDFFMRSHICKPLSYCAWRRHFGDTGKGSA